MTIAITISSAVAVETYDGLASFLTEHLELSSETIAQLPNLIRLAEYRLNRLLTGPDRETSVTLSTVAGTQAVTLPNDSVAINQVRLEGSTGYPLDFVSIGSVEQAGSSGKPVCCHVYGGQLLLGPVPDAVYSLQVRYQQRLPLLSDGNTTNWLLVDHADAYVYMCAAIICLHDDDKPLAEVYLSLANEVVAEVNKQGIRERFGTPLVPVVAVP